MSLAWPCLSGGALGSWGLSVAIAPHFSNTSLWGEEGTQWGRGGAAWTARRGPGPALPWLLLLRAGSIPSVGFSWRPWCPKSGAGPLSECPRQLAGLLSSSRGGPAPSTSLLGCPRPEDRVGPGARVEGCGQSATAAVQRPFPLTVRACCLRNPKGPSGRPAGKRGPRREEAVSPRPGPFSALCLESGMGRRP